MVLFNYATKEITAKVVYYGPGLCGKTTNLQFVYDSLPSNNRSKMLSLATKTDRTLFFDFLPLDLGKIRGMRTKLQLYTVPGQVYYNSTRQLVLKGSDGVVFVADSQDFALDANNESLQNLEDNLKRQGIRISDIPLVIQYNKRDLPNALSIEELNRGINRLNVPSFESVATTGIGVERTLKGITQLVLSHLVKKYGLEGGSEPLEKEINVLNATIEGSAPSKQESVWADDAASPAAASNAVVFDADDAPDNIPLVATELLSAPNFSPSSPFDELIESFDGGNAAQSPFTIDPPSIEVPIGSVEIPLPELLLNSLPKLQEPATAPVPPPQAPAPLRSVPPPAPVAESQAGSDRRAADGLVREVTLPLNLSMDELKRFRKLKLKITLDINLLS